MEVKEAINQRRAYRSLDPIDITPQLVDDLATCAQLAPSCFNNQPWKFVFVYDSKMLVKLHSALSPGNEWVHSASMIIAVFGKKEEDCVLKEREYYLFDIGMAVAFIILRATELGLVAHPIAGYDPDKAKEVLGIPQEMMLITLINVGKHSSAISPILSEKQRHDEIERPRRKALSQFVYINAYKSDNP
jgi:nitroreductase